MRAPDHSSGVLRRRDTSLHYGVSGSGPAIVFTHGLGGPALAALTPRGASASIPAAGHSAYFERAQRFNEIVEQFLDSTQNQNRTQATPS